MQHETHKIKDWIKPATAINPQQSAFDNNWNAVYANQRPAKVNNVREIGK
ncbi:hypothetical protein [Glaciimonas immobilis]|uniref:Uncharacterized protein n=1 Tax=Glaciimonas immobilis TaxID=728004 RepID=A0A840RSH0_9BURK|nr:hypothetical protein [Glaciimonas immobilis]KAF3997566.1 hypothetical protein HAV38_12890 [Glaciimonas immobilis]MBB5200745.1 hypothetical protein [Glaciimonas immobilis]